MTKGNLISKAIELHSNGKSYGEIATLLKVGKTTVYNWITSVPRTKVEMNVPNTETRVSKAKPSVSYSFENEMNDLNQIKHELENEYGTENNINPLVQLRKAELEHDHKMERLEIERQTLLHKQKMEAESIKANRLALQLEEMRTDMENANQRSERLDSSLNNLKQNNEILSMQVDELSIQNQKKDLDNDLQDAYETTITDYLDLEGDEITPEEVDIILKEAEEYIKQFKKWVKNTNGKKLEYPELKTLKKIRNKLLEMINEFEEKGEDELIFTFDLDFVKELKQLH